MLILLNVDSIYKYIFIKASTIDEKEPEKKKSSNTGTILAIVFSVFAVLLVGGILGFLYLRRKRSFSRRKQSHIDDSYGSSSRKYGSLGGDNSSQKNNKNIELDNIKKN